MQEENENVACLYSREENQVKMRSDLFQVIVRIILEHNLTCILMFQVSLNIY